MRKGPVFDRATAEIHQFLACGLLPSVRFTSSLHLRKRSILAALQQNCVSPVLIRKNNTKALSLEIRKPRCVCADVFTGS